MPASCPRRRGTLPDEPGSVVVAVRDNPLMILDDVEPAEVAAAVAALLEDGRRVIVTAEDTAALGAMRSMLPAAVTDRIVGALPTLAPADVHRLRGLLATSTPARRARTTQQLPDLAAFPDADAVAQLCVTALRSSAPGVEVIADVLGELDADRRGAVSAIAQCVQRSLRAAQRSQRAVDLGPARGPRGRPAPVGVRPPRAVDRAGAVHHRRRTRRSAGAGHGPAARGVGRRARRLSRLPRHGRPRAQLLPVVGAARRRARPEPAAGRRPRARDRGRAPDRAHALRAGRTARRGRRRLRHAGPAHPAEPGRADGALAGPDRYRRRRAFGRGAAPRRAVPAPGLAGVGAGRRVGRAVRGRRARLRRERLPARGGRIGSTRWPTVWPHSRRPRPPHPSTRAPSPHCGPATPAVTPRRSTSSSVPTWPSATSGAPACCSPGSGPSRSPARGRTEMTVHRSGSGWSGSHRRSGCSPSCRHRTGRTSWWCSTPAASASTAR